MDGHCNACRLDGQMVERRKKRVLPTDGSANHHICTRLQRCRHSGLCTKRPSSTGIRLKSAVRLQTFIFYSTFLPLLMSFSNKMGKKVTQPTELGFVVSLVDNLEAGTVQIANAASFVFDDRRFEYWLFTFNRAACIEELRAWFRFCIKHNLRQKLVRIVGRND